MIKLCFGVITARLILNIIRNIFFHIRSINTFFAWILNPDFSLFVWFWGFGYALLFVRSIFDWCGFRGEFACIWRAYWFFGFVFTIQYKKCADSDGTRQRNCRQSVFFSVFYEFFFACIFVGLLCSGFWKPVRLNILGM